MGLNCVPENHVYNILFSEQVFQWDCCIEICIQLLYRQQIDIKNGRKSEQK